jgi:hypothetical protein
MPPLPSLPPSLPLSLPRRNKLLNASGNVVTVEMLCVLRWEPA